MAMMISKFNRLISSRLLWGVILVLIIFSFVIWGMQWPSEMRDPTQQSAAGKLDDTEISREDYQAAYRSTYLAYVLNSERDQMTNLGDNELRQATWQRLVTLRMAAKLGITATDQEVLSTIRNSFSDPNGVFYADQYKLFVQQTLPSMGFVEVQFEAFMRQEIVLRKLAFLLGRQALLTPAESLRMYHILMDEYSVEYISLGTDAVENEVTTTREDAQKAFDAAPDTFMRPETRELLFVRFPYADYAGEAAFPEDEIQDYYDLHIQDFAMTNVVEGVPQVSYVDLADAQADITARLHSEKMKADAEQAAMSFAYQAVPGRDGVIPDFRQIAGDAGRTVEELQISLFEPTPLPEAGDDFIPTAFSLEMNVFDRVSSAVLGEDAAFIFYLQHIQTPRIPDFEEVEAQAMSVARSQALSAALMARLESIKATAEEKLAAGETFASAMQGLGLTVQNPDPFTGLGTASADNLEMRALVQTAVGYNQGEVTEPIWAGSTMLIAYIKAVTPADATMFDVYRPQINQSVQGMRGMLLLSGWQQSLLSPARFTDFQPAADMLDEDEDVAEAEAAD